MYTLKQFAGKCVTNYRVNLYWAMRQGITHSELCTYKYTHSKRLSLHLITWDFSLKWKTNINISVKLSAVVGDKLKPKNHKS